MMSESTYFYGMVNGLKVSVTLYGLVRTGLLHYMVWCGLVWWCPLCIWSGVDWSGRVRYGLWFGTT